MTPGAQLTNHTASVASDVPDASSGIASAPVVRPEGFPRCRVCFRFRRVCDGGRPCATCSRAKKGQCRNVTQEDLDEFPKRAQKVLHDHELQKSTTSNNTKRSPSTDAPHDEQTFKKKQERELKHCYRVVNELLSDKYADCNVHFLYPVDHVALNLPHYRSIVEFPMDLSTMKENMEDGEYRSAREFKKDFMKVVNAARLFNETGSEVYAAANELQRVFNEVWEETKKASRKSEKYVAVESEDQPEEEEQTQNEI